MSFVSFALFGEGVFRSEATGEAQVVAGRFGSSPVGRNGLRRIFGGVLFDMSRSYTPSFVFAGISGVLNLAVIGALITRSVSSLMIAGRAASSASK